MRVGYAGGTTVAPTYRAIGDHTECFQVDFDPAVVSYEALLDLFWGSHDATRPPYKTQYASLVLAHDDVQLATARESAARHGAQAGRPVATRIERLDRFWPAEEYHQKYYLRQDRLLAREFAEMFAGDEDALRESTAALRVNSYLAGAGSAERLSRSDIASLGLSERGRAHLAEQVDGAYFSGSCGVAR